MLEHSDSLEIRTRRAATEGSAAPLPHTRQAYEFFVWLGGGAAYMGDKESA